MTLPPPPDPLDPKIETIPAGALFYRVHEPVLPNGATNDGTVMNPGFGKPTRFAFFGNPSVPVLYAADRPEGAVHESILHDAEPGMFIPRRAWETKILSAVATTTDITVACFHSDGLRKFGLYPADLTDTDSTEYPSTVQWAQAAWSAGVAGVSYMCRHFNTSKALCLFGDRLPPGALRPLPQDARTRVFVLPADAEWLAAQALSIRVVLRP